MQDHVDKAHAQLGELAAMSHQTQEAEHKILAEAERMLAQVERDLPAAAGAAMTDGKDRYMELIAERGRLQQVIAQARQHLGARPE